MTSAVRVGGPHLRGSQPPHERVVERTFPVTPGAARLARATTQVACRAWSISSACEVVVLAVSELVGNAVRHGGSGRLTLRLFMTPRRLRLEVIDSGEGTPTVRTPPPDAESGRGLWIISELSTRWGVEPAPRGKCIWVEVAL